MYFPYFRGKQFELIAIRELAKVLAQSDFVPIIEPVREALNRLERTLADICDAGGKAIVVVNPFHGDHAKDGDDISALLKRDFSDKPEISAGILLHNDMNTSSAVACHEAHRDHRPIFIHAGFAEAKALAGKLGDTLKQTRHVFFEKSCHKLYRRHFRESKEQILLRDGFQRRRNADHPLVEFFSDLHITYKEEGVTGFGDFLIVGDDFIEGGGPAYAVAIHLTFIDSKQDDVMNVYHFVSKTKDTPTDPAGKFAQALDTLVEKLDSGSSQLLSSDAIGELQELHRQRHFPGLGYVKKLSMKHHVETMAAFFRR
jgi:hypothetical protein